MDSLVLSMIALFMTQVGVTCNYPPAELVVTLCCAFMRLISYSTGTSGGGGGEVVPVVR